MTFFDVLTMIGGMSLFLFGMNVMGDALERRAGNSLRTLLGKLTTNRLLGLFTGLAVTGIIQSSAATTVMVVGFVNSSLMTLGQAINVIMGANIGTTVTAWLLSLTGISSDNLLMQMLKPTSFTPILGLIGVGYMMLCKDEKRKQTGYILLGFTALMLGMDIMTGALKGLADVPAFRQLFMMFTNPVLGVLAGALLTAAIQSSSAAVGVLQALSMTGQVTFGSAIPIILGQNIGTCVTAMMGSIGANRNARRTALVHLLFNVVGVTLFVVLFYGLGLVIDWKFLNETCSAWNVAVVHTCFNVAATCVLMPMNKLLVRLAYLIIPHEYTPQKEELLDERLLGTPAVAVQRAHEVAAEMMADAREAMALATGLTRKFDAKVMEKVIELEDKTDRYEDALGTYLVKLSNVQLSVEDNRILNTLLYTTADIERMADHAVAVARAAREMEEKKMNFSEAAKAELAVLARAVTDVMDRTALAYGDFERELALKVEPQEQVVDSLVREVKSRHVRRLRDGLCSVEYGFVLEDLLTAMERTADHCSNVAVEILQVSEGKLEAHEYLTALKAGELHESAAYAERFARYKAQYAFPEEMTQK